MVWKANTPGALLCLLRAYMPLRQELPGKTELTMSQISAPPAYSKAHLLSLPAETRCQIYPYLFFCGNLTVSLSDYHLGGPKPKLTTSSQLSNAQVLRVCTTVRVEARPYFFQALNISCQCYDAQQLDDPEAFDNSFGQDDVRYIRQIKLFDQLDKMLSADTLIKMCSLRYLEIGGDSEEQCWRRHELSLYIDEECEKAMPPKERQLIDSDGCMAFIPLAKRSYVESVTTPKSGLAKIFNNTDRGFKITCNFVFLYQPSEEDVAEDDDQESDGEGWDPNKKPRTMVVWVSSDFSNIAPSD